VHFVGFIAKFVEHGFYVAAQSVPAYFVEIAMPE
jgi:hypothetical protein